MWSYIQIESKKVSEMPEDKSEDKIKINTVKAEEKIKIPSDYDALYLLIGYNENYKLIITEADENWYYDAKIIFSLEPERHVILKKKRIKSKTPISVLYLSDGKFYDSQSEAEAEKGKPKKTFFS
jgi:hypothetical protein